MEITEVLAMGSATLNSLMFREGFLNPSQEGYYNSINPLVEGVPPHIHRPPPGGSHIFTGLEYSGASARSRPYFPVVQFIGLQYSVLGSTITK